VEFDVHLASGNHLLGPVKKFVAAWIKTGLFILEILKSGEAMLPLKQKQKDDQRGKVGEKVVEKNSGIDPGK
jgi:hypothetical protein